MKKNRIILIVVTLVLIVVIYNYIGGKIGTPMTEEVTDKSGVKYSTTLEGSNVKLVPLVVMDEVEDLQALFTFDTEVVDTITLISPSNVEYSEEIGNVKYKGFEDYLIATYVVENAEIGQWYIAYDKGANQDIKFSIQDPNYTIEDAAEDGIVTP